MQVVVCAVVIDADVQVMPTDWTVGAAAVTVIANAGEDTEVFSVDVATTFPVPVVAEEKMPAAVTVPTEPVASAYVTLLLVVPSL